VRALASRSLASHPPGAYRGSEPRHLLRPEGRRSPSGRGRARMDRRFRGCRARRSRSRSPCNSDAFRDLLSSWPPNGVMETALETAVGRSVKPCGCRELCSRPVARVWHGRWIDTSARCEESTWGASVCERAPLQGHARAQIPDCAEFGKRGSVRGAHPEQGLELRPATRRPAGPITSLGDSGGEGPTKYSPARDAG
jgi:hypothetical protein